MTDLYEQLSEQVQSWIAGEMSSTEAHTVLDWVVQAKESAGRHVSELEAMRGTYESPALEDAIRDAKGRHDQFIRLWNAMVIETRRREAARYAKITDANQWRDGKQALSGDWLPIDINKGLVTWCCHCDTPHVREFRIVDGQLEMRSYLLPENERLN